MKKYSANNYSKYRKDLNDNLKRIEGKMWDEYTRDELIVKFMPLVESLARRFSTSSSASGVMTVTAGGAGTTATGQFVSEVTVD